MTVQEKGVAIIEGIKALPKSVHGDFHYIEELIHIIDGVMRYEEYRFRGGGWASKQPVKVSEIIRRMEAKGIIKRSKSGAMFKLMG